jgi:hypothetical protein
VGSLGNAALKASTEGVSIDALAWFAIASMKMLKEPGSSASGLCWMFHQAGA